MIKNYLIKEKETGLILGLCKSKKQALKEVNQYNYGVKARNILDNAFEPLWKELTVEEESINEL